jgi:branched-chain amino acid transport system permease protein
MVNASLLYELTVSGLGIGALYSLVAIGFVLIYKITGVLNFAQGAIALLGAYGVIILTNSGVPPYEAVVLLVVLGVPLGYLMERLLFRHFVGEPVLSVILVTLALASVIEGVIQLRLGGSQSRALPGPLQIDWSVPIPFGETISGSFAIGVLLALLTVISLVMVFRYTVIGAALQATASDQQAAEALGISIKRTTMIAWILAIVITMIGGLLLAASRGSATFAIENVGIVIFTAVILGGLDSIVGAFVGSLAVGLLEIFGSYFFESIVGPGFGIVLPLVFLLFVIVIRPHGLYGTEHVERL